MTNPIKKMILPTIALSLMFIVPAGAVESPAAAGLSREQTAPQAMAFQIPANSYCSAEESHDFSLQVANAGEAEADITLYLYNQDGTEFTSEGSSYRDIGSTIVPSKPAALKAHATGLYHINFGNHKTCAERVYLGKVVVNSGEASLLAQGWVSINGQKEAITVNENKRFELAAPSKPPVEEPAAASAPAGASTAVPAP
ncbi:hypothetical protein CF651_04465 [Paenibacillus rigui]|uniref:Uncharacterized protein n=2 Tax=Paenibacillus rigui TaxID=554312 RepID=A0A229UVZ3_9BACL|nr:hypothetical protein CF651_04465 [Paenibacillus rigui]